MDTRRLKCAMIHLVAPALPQQDAARVRELRSALRTWVDAAPSVLTTLTPQLPSLLCAERAAAYGLAIGEQALSLDSRMALGSRVGPARTLLVC